MKERRGLALLALGIVAATALSFVLSARPIGAEASSLSAGARGLLVARRYLEERGVSVRLLDSALERKHEADVVVLAFPFQRLLLYEDPTLEELERRTQRGATLVLAYSGDALPSVETDVMRRFGLRTSEPRGRAPLNPLRFRAYSREEWRLEAAHDDWSAATGASIAAPSRLPKAPAQAEIWLRGPNGVPVAFAFPRGRGRVVAVPADALSNGRLARPENAALMEALRRAAPGKWSIDEYHHGLVGHAASAGAVHSRLLDLYLLHLAALYALAVLALARRFGPAWTDPPVISGSTSAFLLRLGALHDRLGHHVPAARRLVERARDLDPRIRMVFRPPASAAEFLELARAVGRSQRR